MSTKPSAANASCPGAVVTTLCVVLPAEPASQKRTKGINNMPTKETFPSAFKDPFSNLEVRLKRDVILATVSTYNKTVEIHLAKDDAKRLGEWLIKESSQ